jgi:hypothetical protein
MAAFNPADYETVEARIRRFYEAHPDGRIITEDLTTPQDRAVSTWRVKTTIYLNADDQEKGLAKATGHAFEIDGQGMANKTSAWENAETSSIGRCLANMNLSGNKRASREEMEKVARANAPKRDWLAEAEALALVYNLDGLRKLYSEAVASRVDAKIIEQVKQLGNDLSGSQDSNGKSDGN